MLIRLYEKEVMTTLKDMLQRVEEKLFKNLGTCPMSEDVLRHPWSEVCQDTSSKINLLQPIPRTPNTKA